jgi:hypothetical protein
MAQTRGQIAQIIGSLRLGDEVKVTWKDGVNQSIETGTIWNPSDSIYWGLGPDVLNPDDLEIIDIQITKRSPVVVAEPAMGAVAIWSLPGGRVIHAAKRTPRGWALAGQDGALPWGIYVLAYGAPIQVISPGLPPPAPVINTLTPGAEKITVAASLGSPTLPITNVQYNLFFEYGDGTMQSGWLATNQTTGTFEITGLESGDEYSVMIRSVNAAGNGPASNVLSATPT